MLLYPRTAIAEPGTFSPDASARWLLDARSVDPFLVKPETPSVPQKEEKPAEVIPEAPVLTSSETRTAYITGYNTVAGQTDDTPCIAAAGNICGRMDTVACPSDLPLLSWVEISGKRYQCMDRTARKHDGRFDISCDKDMECPYRLTGWKEVKVLK